MTNRSPKLELWKVVLGPTGGFKNWFVCFLSIFHQEFGEGLKLLLDW